MSSDMREIVIDALHKAIGVRDNSGLAARLADPSADIAVDELGLDSLTAIEWCMEIEQATGLELDPEVLGRVRTLAGLVGHVSERMPPS